MPTRSCSPGAPASSPRRSRPASWPATRWSSSARAMWAAATGCCPTASSAAARAAPSWGRPRAPASATGPCTELFTDTPAYTGGDTLDMPAKGTLGERLFAQGGVFDGWGYVHLLNANTLQEIDAYAVPQALDQVLQDRLWEPPPSTRSTTPPRQREPGLHLLLRRRLPRRQVRQERASARLATSSTRAATTSGGSNRSSWGTAGSHWFRPATATSACTCSTTPASSPP